MDTMKLGDVRGRKLKSITEILVKEFEKIFEGKKYFKPKFEVEYKETNVGFGNRDKLETDIIDVSIEYKGYYFALGWTGNPLNMEVPQRFNAKWSQLPKGAADHVSYLVLNQAIFKLSEWIKTA